MPLLNPPRATEQLFKNDKVILNEGSARAKVAGRCAVKDPVESTPANEQENCRSDHRVLTGFFGCAMPATFAHRALLLLRMTAILR